MGKPSVPNSLRGQDTRPDIRTLKVFILNQFVIPMTSNQWEVLRDNLICVDRIKHTLGLYKKMDPELDMYLELIRAVECTYREHNQLKALEKQMFTGSETTLLQKLPPLRFKPEYEIYHCLYGKTRQYDETRLSNISRLLAIPYMTMERIREILSTQGL